MLNKQKIDIVLYVIDKNCEVILFSYLFFAIELAFTLEFYFSLWCTVDSL